MMRRRQSNSSQWAERYRPQSIEDLILPASLRARFQAILDAGHVPNLLLHGPAGCGKTTIAQILTAKIADPANVLFINGSLDGRIAVLRDDIVSQATCSSLYGGRKHFVMDEADHMSDAIQAGLRAVIERNDVAWIFIANDPKAIIRPIHSRCVVIAFDDAFGEPERHQFLEQVHSILEQERVAYDPDTVAHIVDLHFPDFRATLHELQGAVTNGRLDATTVPPRQTFGIEAIRPVEWLWENRLALGKVTSLAGKEDRKKSLLAVHIAAMVNQGGEWPDGGRPVAGNVILLQAEDGFADTTLPRLLAAGAQVTRDPVQGPGPPYYTIVPKLKATTLTATLDALRGYLRTTKDLRLLIVDPFNAFAEGQTAHRMPAALQRLMDVAESHSVAVLLVHHFNKQTKPAVREMIYGSGMVCTKSRLVLAVQEDPDDATLSILTGNKNNAGASPASGLVYGAATRELVIPGGGKRAFPVIAWQGPDDRMADEIAGELVEKVKAAGKVSKERRKDRLAQDHETAVEFLKELIITPRKAVRANDIEKAARTKGICVGRFDNCRVLQRAANELEIDRRGKRAPPGGGPAVSWWSPPAADQAGARGKVVPWRERDQARKND